MRGIDSFLANLQALIVMTAFQTTDLRALVVAGTPISPCAALYRRPEAPMDLEGDSAEPIVLYVLDCIIDLNKS